MYIIVFMFFPQKIHTYTLLTTQLQACSLIHHLIQQGLYQFQCSGEDPTHPSFHYWVRLMRLKHTIQPLLPLPHPLHTPPPPPTTDYFRFVQDIENQATSLSHTYHSHMQAINHILLKRQSLEEQILLVHQNIALLDKGQFSEFKIIAGAMNASDLPIVQKVIFRRTKGRAVCKSHIHHHRCVMLCIASKGVQSKVRGVFSNYTYYDLPQDRHNLQDYQQKLMKQLTQVHQMDSLQHGAPQRHQLSDIYSRLHFVQRVMYYVSHSTHIGDHHLIITTHTLQPSFLPPHLLVTHHTLKDILSSTTIQQITPKHPRTAFLSLDVLRQCNMLTQLYSVPQHNEIVPSIFMLSTVPFMFGLMFSDVGHGLLLLFLCRKYHLPLFAYLMALMSVYCGCIYNQVFGMKFIHTDHIGIVRADWGIAQNALPFQNSLKMKISVIVALFHLLLGQSLNIVNQLHRRQYEQIFYDSLPKCILLFCTVGYMDALIVVKWLTNYNTQYTQYTPPSVITTMLQLFMGIPATRSTSILSSIECEHTVANTIRTMMLLCILLMVYNHTCRNTRKDYITLRSMEDDIDEMSEREDMGIGPLEIFQYVLSLLSSTTSYLRLFALSLAHAKMSQLMLGYVCAPLRDVVPCVSYVRMGVFIVCTLLMMVGLDGVECVMHVVRLHWVEWMGRFYQGNGRKFSPVKVEDEVQG